MGKKPMFGKNNSGYNLEITPFKWGRNFHKNHRCLKKYIPFLLIYKIMLQMQISTKKNEKKKEILKPGMCSYFSCY